MNDFENKIKKIMKKEIEHPLSYDYAIKNAFANNKKRKFGFKLLAPMACLIMLCTGVMATSHIVYEKIWKNPVIINQKEEVDNIKKEITKEEKSGYISEEKAKKIAEKIIKKLGYKNIKISNIELKRGYDSEYSSHYIIKANDILISINPKNGKLDYFGDNSINAKNIKCDEISKEKAKEIARKIYSDLEIFDNINDYEIVNTERVNVGFREHINDMWQVSFGKTFNVNYDKNNISTICFSICDDNIVVSSITGQRENNLENNPVIITKEQAIEIAKNKEKQFSNLEISNITANLSIEKMNTFVYCLENNITNENGELKIDDISRNVWIVNVQHNKKSRPKDGKIETVKKQYNKKYYIDTTTGEIIGGEQSEFFN